MKKNLFLLILSLTLCGLTTVQAQSQSGCELYISTDFDSECLLTEYVICSPLIVELGLYDCILACKGNTVRYTAVCPNASQYNWVIAGASHYHFINQGQTAVVTWGYGVTGNISVSVVVGDTNTCTAETCVLLMDSPDAQSTSVPSYYYTQEREKVIEICLGETIDFVDMSTTDRTPITGYYWESAFGAASTQNYSLTPLAEGEYEVVHCVRNECGCENCESYRIIVKAPVELELSCYGTVCENTTASYSIINPRCGRYFWNVEGGSLEGQGTPDITVHWGSPASGYGVISLDASMCETECNSLLSIQIPIITNNTEISGPETVCVGDMQIYELPRWGSTEYTWWNSNSFCMNVHNGRAPSQYMLEFTQPGTVTIGAKYICRFLNCGYLAATPKTIIVKDTMSIHSDKDTYCKGEMGIFHTTHTNPVRWRVYNQNNQQIYTTNSVSLSYTFTSAGKFKITASHSDYCKIAEYHVTVLNNPPALTSTTGAHMACPGGSILLEATPTHPRYYLVWEPVCYPASSEEGNKVTITFANGVCDVAVYQVDNEYNCRSDAYIHEVDTFRLLPHGLPAITTACAGSTVQFDVPDQAPYVTYEWTINPANAASIDSSDHLLPSVGMLTNHLSNVTPPYLVDVELKRTYCSNLKVYETVQLLIEDVVAPTLACPDTVCEDELVALTASGNTTEASHYQWSFSDTLQTFQGTSVSRKFYRHGYVYVTVTYQPNLDCDPVTVRDTIWVNSKPYADIIHNGNIFQVELYPNASYVWTHNGNVVSYTNRCPEIGYGTYCCIITTPFCSDSACYTISPGSGSCIPVNTIITDRTCNDFTIEVTSPLGPQYSWGASTQANGSYCSPSQASNTTTAHINVLGTHHVDVYAELNGQCYHGRRLVTVDCLPEIEVSYDCNGHIIVQDISQYRSGYTIPNRTVTIGGTSLTATIYSPQMRVSIPTNILSEGTYTVYMSVGNTGCVCSKDITYEYNPRIISINIPSNMCEKTPFLFSATTDHNNLQYYWDFGDDSYNSGNNIYHTYDYNFSSLYFDVMLIVTNPLGCADTSTQTVTVHSNVFEPTSLNTQSSTQVCPGTPRTIQFSQSQSNALYTWSPLNLTYDNLQNNCNVYQTGDYGVEAYYPYFGCRAKATCNVGFLTAPWARIIGNTEYCLGETVKLNGNTGANNIYTWNVTGPLNFSYTSFDDIISFTPSEPGTYTVTLTVSNQGDCSATATCTLTVNPKPAAPSIAFSGNHCIHEPPVVVQSTTGQSLLWSNGYHGTTAYSYSDGYLTAHYIDPSTGCRSYNAEIFIEPAPNFDALLTGCYKLCPEQLKCDLPIYGIYPYVSGYLNWDWIFQPVGSIYTVIDQDPLLPLIDFGTYYLDARYTAGCTVSSPELIIDKAPVCPCDSVSLKTQDIECKVSGCKLYYYLNYSICNDGSEPLNFGEVRTNIGGNIVYASPLPLFIAPRDCQNFYLEIEYTDFMSSTFEFVLIDYSRNCELKYVENIDWQSCIPDDCGELHDYWFDFYYDISTSHESSYFQFHVTLPNVLEVLSVWSKPSQVIDFTGSGSYPVELDGLMMLDYGLLSQMYMNDQLICLYVIACLDGEQLCYDSICIPPYIFWEQIPEDFRQLSGSSMADNDSTRSFRFNMDVPQDGKPYLAPNPAHDEVTVMGIAPENVSQITVLTMQGGQVADYRNDYRFNVSRLSKAVYIVRVITTDRKVHYLKLVKQ